MQEYIDRLIRCGYSPCDAYFTYHSFVRELNVNALDAFIASLEKDIRIPCGHNIIQTP